MDPKEGKTIYNVASAHYGACVPLRSLLVICATDHFLLLSPQARSL